MTVNTNTIKLGVYVGNPNNSDPGEQAATSAQFSAFTQAMGRAPTLMDTFIDENLDESQWVSNAQWSADSWAASSWLKGVMPVIGLPMASNAQASNPGAVFNDIISGRYDSVYTGIFQAYVNDGFTSMYIRPGYEMNGEWSPWFTGNGNEGAFTAAFQHIADLAHNFAGGTIQTVWNPAVYWGSGPATNYYPGDQAVDVIAADTYSGTNPADTSTDPNNFTLQDAINLAQTHNKPFGLAETGSGPNNGTGHENDATFTTALAHQLQQANVKVAFVNVWDFTAPDGDWNFTGAGENRPAELKAWHDGFGAAVATTVPPAHLSIVLAEDRYQGDAKFIAKVDGITIAGSTAVTALHKLGQTQTFDFTGQWGSGVHKVEIDFINDKYGGTPQTDRNLYINAVSLSGSNYLRQVHEQSSNGAFVISVGH